MDPVRQAKDTIYRELTSDDADVRKEYMRLFENEANEFAEHMARAVVSWQELDAAVKADEKRGMVTALVYAAITLHVVSLKLFLSGHIVPAGNLFRQVVESMALAMLCSGKDLGVLQRFMEDKYSTNDAIRDVLRNAETLGLKQD